jgi:hypothetical protein
MSLLRFGPYDFVNALLYQYGRYRVPGLSLEKQATEPSYDLSGMLQLHQGALVINVPNALVRGIFDAMDQPGVQLPNDAKTNRLWAHAVVLTSGEVAKIGADKIRERGKRVRYRLGGLLSHTLAPSEQKLGAVWLLLLHSPELQEVRRSYGLSSLPSAGGFYCLVAIKKRGVLSYTTVSRLSPHDGRLMTELSSVLGDSGV